MLGSQMSCISRILMHTIYWVHVRIILLTRKALAGACTSDCMAHPILAYILFCIVQLRLLATGFHLYTQDITGVVSAVKQLGRAADIIIVHPLILICPVSQLLWCGHILQPLDREVMKPN